MYYYFTTWRFIFLCVVWNLARMILELIGSQLRRALCASLESMNATPSVCGAEPSRGLEYSVNPPLAKLWTHCLHAVFHVRRHLFFSLGC